jgi:hypothetical protein
LGTIHEGLEQHEKARDSYDYVVTYWKDADPELQPIVDAAREAIAGLETRRSE